MHIGQFIMLARIIVHPLDIQASHNFAYIPLSANVLICRLGLVREAL